MLRTTHSFIASNGSAERSTIIAVRQPKVPERVLGHYGCDVAAFTVRVMLDAARGLPQFKAGAHVYSLWL